MMADVWPIESVWAIVEQRAKKEYTTSKAELRKAFTKIRKGSDHDKDKYKRLMRSISKKLLAGKAPRRTMISLAIKLTNF